MKSSVKSILFLAEAVSLAHIGRPLKLAQWAASVGYEVYFACSTKVIQIPRYEQQSFACYELPCIKPTLFYQRLQQGMFPYTLQELQDYLREELRLIKELQPDFIVSDFRLTSALAGEITKTPTAQISNLHWSSYSDCEFLPDIHSNYHKLPFGLGVKFFNMIRPIAFRKFAAPLRRLRAMFGLPEVKDFRDIYTGSDYTLFADMPGFTKTKPLPATSKILGPILWAPDSLNQEFALDLTKKYIYITIGSSGKAAAIKKIVSALLDTAYSFIITGIDQEESRGWGIDLSVIRERCTFSFMVDPNQFLRYCDLTICHGGSGTVYQSLAAGVPVLCIPSNPDQYLVSKSVMNHKLGNFIFTKRLSEASIRERARNILQNHEIAQRCAEYALTMKEQNAKANWVFFLASLNFTPKDVAAATTRRTMVKKCKPKLSAVSQVLEQFYALPNLQPVAESEFSVEIVTNAEDRKSAFRLAYQVYKEKGYAHINEEEMLIFPYDHAFDTTIFVAKNKEHKVVGSLTLVFDETTVLPSSAIFEEEIESLKNKHERVVECCRLVVDSEYRNSKEILLLMFNYLMIYIHHVRKGTSLIIEVNPRHQKFYDAMLSFTPLGSEKPCPLVQNAPAVLMHLPMQVYQDQVVHYTTLKISNIPFRTRSMYAAYMNTMEELVVAEELSSQFHLSVYQRLAAGDVILEPLEKVLTSV